MSALDWLSSPNSFIYSKSAFTCNWDESSSRDETRSEMKKFLPAREFHPGIQQVEFNRGMKFNLKGNFPLSMKTYDEIYHFILTC